MRLWEACEHHLATVNAAPKKVQTYSYWIEELLDRFAIDAELHALTTEALRDWSQACADKGNSPATIKGKMSLASGIYRSATRHGYDGPLAAIPYPYVPRANKWWLTPDLERRALQWCTDQCATDLRDYLEWTIETGLRLEETMRCSSMHFIGLMSDSPELSVPGTKTDDAQATLPISLRAAQIARLRLASSPMLFEITSYYALARRWRRCRKALGITDSTATLKAMRRRFARTMASRGCPLPVLQQMLRHRDPETTLDYLRLTGGGFTLDEMRKYL